MKKLSFLILFIAALSFGYQGDSLGSHKATKNLNMAYFEITNRTRNWLSVVTSTDVATEITQDIYTTFTGNWDDCALSNFTRSGSTFTYTGVVTRKFMAMGRLTFTAAAATTGLGAFFVNGDIKSDTIDEQSVTATALRGKLLPGCSFELSTGDEIYIGITTDDGDNLTVRRSHIAIWAIE